MRNEAGYLEGFEDGEFTTSKRYKAALNQAMLALSRMGKYQDEIERLRVVDGNDADTGPAELMRDREWAKLRRVLESVYKGV